MQYVVTGTKNPSDKTRSKFFACKTDAERFASKCSWNDVRVFKLTPVVPRKETNPRLKSRSLDNAVRYLQLMGYEILEREYSCDAGTMDVVAADDGAIVFIEVNLRTAMEQGLPDDFDKQAAEGKRDAFERIAMEYLSNPGTPADVHVRFDMLDMMVTGPDRAFARHYVNVFGEGF